MFDVFMFHGSHCSRFLHAVHRRLVIIRALERCGACLAVACGFAGVLSGAMLWRGEDGRVLAAGTLLLGAMIGLAWGLVRRPRLGDAALVADSQLELSDLLATALATASNADAWSRAVVAMA